MNCEDCGKVFASIRGMNLHKARYCYGKVPRLDDYSTFKDAAFFFKYKIFKRISKETHNFSTTTNVLHLGSYNKGVLAPRSLQYGCGLQSGSPYKRLLQLRCVTRFYNRQRNGPTATSLKVVVTLDQVVRFGYAPVLIRMPSYGIVFYLPPMTLYVPRV